MSEGTFVDSRYQRNNGDIHPIRVQPETLLASFDATINTAPAGPTTSDITAKTSRGNRGFGLKPRTVTIKWTGVVPDGYDPQGLVTIPVLQQAAWEAIDKNTVITYLGGTGKQAFKSPERVG